MTMLPAHDGRGDFAPEVEEADMHKSKSWAETSGKHAKHAFEAIDDGTANEELKRLWSERKARNRGDGLDGWALDRHVSSCKASPAARKRQLEGWNYVRAIAPRAFEKLALEIKPEGACTARLVDLKDGMNNLVAIVEFDNKVKICIRVPCCASPKVWNSAARATLRNAVDTMRFLHASSGLRVPNVLAWDQGFKNRIKAPHMITEFVEGKSVNDVFQLWMQATLVCPPRDCSVRGG